MRSWGKSTLMDDLEIVPVWQMFWKRHGRREWTRAG